MARRRIVHRPIVNSKWAYHLLPVVFWLLAIGGTLVPFLPITNHQLPITNYRSGYWVALIVLICIAIIKRIKRHETSMEECFLVALLLGICSYWIPTVVVLIIPVWGYLYARNLFSTRSLVASLLGFTTVALWAVVLVAIGWIENVWASFFALDKLWGWIPLGAILLAWLGTRSVHNTLRPRNVF